MTDTATCLDRYLAALRARDFGEVPFAAEATFDAPLLEEPLRGRDTLVAVLTEAAGTMQDIQEIFRVVQGDRASSIFRYTTDGARHEVCDCFTVINGEIAAIQAFFDPRPFLD